MRRTAKSTAKTTHKSDTVPFGLSTVKTKSQEPASRKSNRLFGIEEAPTFYPTKDEFKDPLRYIDKISPQGEKYGIIKIVPPKDYNPDFSLKTEVCLHFQHVDFRIDVNSLFLSIVLSLQDSYPEAEQNGGRDPH